jgi:hypothetical protein
VLTQVVRVRSSGQIPVQDRWAPRVATCPWDSGVQPSFLALATNTTCSQHTAALPVYSVKQGMLLPRECDESGHVRGIVEEEQDVTAPVMDGMAATALNLVPMGHQVAF